jgi:hypothetical protein
VQRLHLLQIDSVNVLVRAHYLPLFSRLGPYPTDVLDRLAYRRRELFEYWGHQASLIPIELHRFFRWRMESAGRGILWPGFARWANENALVIDAVEREIRERGPLGVSDLSNPGERSGPWWGWSDGKTALEWLYTTGRVTVVGRRNFERIYDLTERVLPPEVLNGRAHTHEESVRELVARAARALGVATAVDVGDYFGIKTAMVKPVLEGMVADTSLVRAQVEGWKGPAFLDPTVRAPRTVDAAALVSPFDSLMFNRKRVARLFGFDYTIEIYVPAPKRVYGYYVLPFLMGERLVARADLKADRKTGALLAHGIFGEPGIDRGAVAERLAPELRAMARWLGLNEVRVGRRGDLSSRVRALV